MSLPQVVWLAVCLNAVGGTATAMMLCMCIYVCLYVCIWRQIDTYIDKIPSPLDRMVGRLSECRGGHCSLNHRMLYQFSEIQLIELVIQRKR